jgi:hypothetical protein
MKVFFEYRNKNIVTGCYEAPEEENDDEGAELRPFGFLTHSNLKFYLSTENKQN